MRQGERARQQLSACMTSAAAAAPHPTPPPTPLPSVCQLAFEVQVKTDTALARTPIIITGDKKEIYCQYVNLLHQLVYKCIPVVTVEIKPVKAPVLLIYVYM